MAIKLSTLLTRIRSRLTAEVAGVRILDIAGPVALQDRPQQRLHKGLAVYCLATADFAHAHGDADQRVIDDVVVQLVYRLRPKGARADSSSALDVEDSIIQALTDHAWAKATTWATPADQPLITYTGTTRDWPLAEWQVSEISFSVYRNQAAN